MKKRLTLLFILCLIFAAGHAQKFVFSPQWTPQSQFAGYYVAYEKGYYKEAGLDVQIIHPTSSYSTINMLKDNKCNVMTSELIQAMMACDQGLNLTNIMQTTQHSTLVLMSRKKGVKEMADIAGSRVGTWKVGFNEIPHMIDDEQKLGIEWIKQLNAINIYIAGAVDATLAKSYNEQILFSMSGVTPGSVLKFSELGFDFPEDGLYVKEEFYERYPEQCRQFAEASRKGWEWARENRKEALDIVMKYVTAEKVATNLYHQKWMLEVILEVQEDKKGEQPSYVLKRDDFERMNKTLLKYKYISAPVEYDRFIGGKQ